MKLELDTQYTFSSADRSLQITVPNGATATLSTQLPGATVPHTQTFTESQLLSGFMGHSIVTVSGAGCEFVVSPSANITKN